MKKSKFIVLAAPSGSGKTTLVNKLLTEVKLNLEFSISATSRKPRKEDPRKATHCRPRRTRNPQ